MRESGGGALLRGALLLLWRRNSSTRDSSYAQSGKPCALHLADSRIFHAHHSTS